MPFVSNTVFPSPSPSQSPSSLLHLAYEVANCAYNGFRGDFSGAAACLRDSGLHHLLSNAWQGATRRYQAQALDVPSVPRMMGAADVVFACALSVLTIGAVRRYMLPELRALENVFSADERARRQWRLETQAQLRRRTPEDLTSMRQCLAAFDATQAVIKPPSSSTDSSRPLRPSHRELSEQRIAEALILHIADTPQTCMAQSDRVAALCQLLAHGLGFKLPRAMREALRVDDARPSLVRYDGAFTLLRERLEPDWRNDTADSPTFTVHPIDVQLFDPAETTDDLSKETRVARRMLTHPEALRHVRSRVVALIAASVREDCGSAADWRDLGELALSAAAQRGLSCDRVLGAMGLAVRSGVSARFAWRWTDEPVVPPGQVMTSTIPAEVAQWLARVMLIAGKLEKRTPCPPRLEALARGDTPPSLVIGSTDWLDLVEGIRALGRKHWGATYAQVREAGKRAGKEGLTR